MKHIAIFSKKYQALDKEIWDIVLPAVFESLLSYAVGLVTSAMIGRLTTGNITANGIGLRVITLVVSIFRGIGVGATVVTGRLYGEGEKQKCRSLIEKTMWISIILCMLCVCAMLLTPQAFLELFGKDDPDLMKSAESYLRIIVWSCPATALSRMVTAAFNGQGDTKTPLLLGVTTNIVNAAISYVLIFGLFGLPAMGLAGAGYGMVVANFCGLLLGFYMMYRKGGLYSGVSREQKSASEKRLLREVFLTGLPASGENLLLTFAAIFLSRALLSYGQDVYAGFQLASQCEELLAAPIFGFQIAATVLIAQYVGRKDQTGTKVCFRRICVLSIVSAIPCALAMLLLPQQMMALITDKVVLQMIGAKYLIILAFAYLPEMLNMASFGAIRSMGYRYTPVIAALTGTWCVRLPVAALCAWVFHADAVFAFGAMAADQIYRIGYALIFIKAKKVFERPGIYDM